MSKVRMIKTKFWEDNYSIDLDPIEKLLFLYLLTNPMTNVCGVYELPLRRMAFDTGIDKEMVSKILNRFSIDNKIYYLKNWVYVVNFMKHQIYNKNMEIGAKKVFDELPEEIALEIAKIETITEPFGRVRYESRKPEPEPELEYNIREPLKTQIKNYKNKDKFSPSMIEDFIRHWSETVVKGKDKGKELWQTKTSWSIGGRLATWKKRSEVFDRKNFKQPVSEDPKERPREAGINTGRGFISFEDIAKNK